MQVTERKNVHPRWCAEDGSYWYFKTMRSFSIGSGREAGLSICIFSCNVHALN